MDRAGIVGGEINSALSRKLSAFAPWTDDEARTLQMLGSRQRRMEAHQVIFYENDAVSDVFLIQRGWTCAYKILSDGARQIIYFPLPGDIVGFSNLVVGKATTSLECLSETIISPISASAIYGVLTSDSKVAQGILWAMEQDRAMMTEHLVSVGRRSALVRTAHLIVEFALRLRLIGAQTDNSFNFPVSQGVLADALGLTAIHVNRILRQLREADLMTLQSGRIAIHDIDQLMALAAFDPTYLSPPRGMTDD
ncbi:Crp/Fnr family transcriptional regulator [Hansschlegelia zhihuaiae]|uniref:Crp/Fnr family transcriptional regulator n=1 Tax=Hansschlegelia zhihuaiae TaxID=405005 RepID=A0A4Q0MCL2_9HYPH|nr:Crp/Fnr family transcriptional regulator [Hansschlegelia zhihuaiae]RXF70935.1 Crp/Fnr family transcriptional regulator [Hansschlegelia zhihuaiae]